MEHLLETMEVVQRACEELLVDAMILTRHQVVVLAIPGFFLFRVQIKNRSIARKKFSAKAQSCASSATSGLTTGSGKCLWSTCFQLVW